MTGIQDLPFDVMLQVLDRIHDRKAIYDCARVNRAFYEAAMPALYTTISLVGLRSYESGPNFAPLNTLDKHQYLRHYVKVVEVCFGLNEYLKHPTLRNSSPQWATSLSQLPNITALRIWHPDHHYYPIRSDFTSTLTSAVSHCEKLENLTLMARINEADLTRFRKLKNVRRMRFGLLTSGTFGALSEWMRVSGCLSLCFMEAYAIEPLTMNQINPHLANLQTLHIGASHALSNKDITSVLSHARQLRFFDFLYDNFLSAPFESKAEYHVNLPHLEAIVIRHSGVWSKPSCQDLFSWLRVVLSSSTSLKSFSLLSDDGKEIHHPQTGLVDVLTSCSTLKILNLPSVVFRLPQLSKIFGSLKIVRVVSLFVTDVKCLDFHQQLRTRGGSKIVAFYLRSNRSTCPYFSVVPKVKEMMTTLKRSGGHFQRLSQEKQTWQALWTEGTMTDRTEGSQDLLKYEYPEMYSHFA
ncbi:hypothetical protein AAF712_007076 [Marasmius tenuissimus]|uniref:F-box domain-containing protein n=1 Tax=Marasmius tenuissimus TaxID=585030 RepID=A0ABR2ZYS9_9AGAR